MKGNKLVLVVDDDPAIRTFLKVALTDEGYEVLVAGNGAIALEMIAQTPPSLVILDMRMPVMDGWAFLDAYCQQELVPAPVISISANATNELVGCVSEFMSKPFNLNVLIDLVARYTNTETMD